MNCNLLALGRFHLSYLKMNGLPAINHNEPPPGYAIMDPNSAIMDLNSAGSKPGSLLSQIQNSCMALDLHKPWMRIAALLWAAITSFLTLFILISGLYIYSKAYPILESPERLVESILAERYSATKAA